MKKIEKEEKGLYKNKKDCGLLLVKRWDIVLLVKRWKIVMFNVLFGLNDEFGDVKKNEKRVKSNIQPSIRKKILSWLVSVFESILCLKKNI